MRDKKTLTIVLASVVVLASAVFLLGTKTSKQRRSPNVIFIVVDALRPDHLGCYGYKRPTSPGIDDFAREGVLFENAFASGSQTMMSVPSILTSLYPDTLNILENGASLSDKFMTLPGILAKNGYRTAAFTGPQLRSIGSLSSHFHAYESISPGRGADNGDATQSILSKATSWIQDGSGEPFFLYMHFLRVHSPYCRPPCARDRFWKEEITPEMEDMAKRFHYTKGYDARKNGIKPDARMVDFLVSLYDADINYIDGRIERFFAFLKEAGLTDNTLIVLLSDHGEELNDRGDFFHGKTLYDEQIRVVLVMRFPKALPQGKRVTELVSLVDVMPTVLDILRIEYNTETQGRSILGMVAGLDPLPELESFSELKYGTHKAIRTKRWKLLARDDGRGVPEPVELYDLQDDPGERVNVLEKYPVESQQLVLRLRDHTRECLDLRARLLGRGPEAEAQQVRLTEEDRDILKSLGYIQ
ncbi:MAG TPA: hypothetical protein DCL35_01045 [Candidatus Omnitrophica bacterium]|nr:hypothetical protein [Candidatus Omnitrophota bacterium]